MEQGILEATQAHHKASAERDSKSPRCKRPSDESEGTSCKRREMRSACSETIIDNNEVAAARRLVAEEICNGLPGITGYGSDSDEGNGMDES